MSGSLVERQLSQGRPQAVCSSPSPRLVIVKCRLERDGERERETEIQRQGNRDRETEME